MEHLQTRAEVWMDLGVGNVRRYKKLGPKISKALPALHAFTGCDFNPALYGRRKKKPLQFLMNLEIFQEAFLDLGSKEHHVQNSFNIINSFTCHLYGLKKLDDVNQARIVIFNKTYNVKDKSQPFSGITMRGQLPKAYEDVVITPDILEDTPGSDTQSEDEIKPEEKDDSTDEDDE
ncbi:unnamed protein product [Psylliodes chrysocephalus]|uniref:Uncharacterized protein n=1 Tax=Psylliodes chrysocephalus TaxID=3402493 RepID=A0A9P0DBK8_9CUCU|nr:unnamed protein product [Psylliodes chrysocephala]